jgi:hypothetical protein
MAARGPRERERVRVGYAGRRRAGRGPLTLTQAAIRWSQPLTLTATLAGLHLRNLLGKPKPSPFKRLKPLAPEARSR